MSQPAKPSDWWNEGVADVCTNFQVDLSCLVDGELDEAAAGRVMVHLEECDVCRDFFEDTLDCLRLHRVAQWLEPVDEREVFIALHERVVLVLLQEARSPLGHLVALLGEEHVDRETAFGCHQGRDEHQVSHPIAQ